MKYFEFSGYEYYALIQAKDIEDAIRQYEADVKELDDDEKEMKPKELSKDEVEKVILRSNELWGDIDVPLLEIDSSMESGKTFTVLIDGSLC